MFFVSVTRLKVKSILYLLKFFKANEASVNQLKDMQGFTDGAELLDKGLVFWTLTVWKDESGMREFRNSNAHRAAMQKQPAWCSEATYVHWMQEEKQMPSWKIAEEKMLAEPKITKVRHPSNNQIEKKYAPIKWTKLERKFKSYS